MKKKIVIALGGNALGNSPEEQLRLVQKTAKYIVDLAFEAMESVGVVPEVKPIRGGTDGARLSFMGLPCPNIFAGGLNFHGRYEYLPVQSLEKSMQTVIKIAELTARKYGK